MKRGCFLGARWETSSFLLNCLSPGRWGEGCFTALHRQSLVSCPSSANESRFFPHSYICGATWRFLDQLERLQFPLHAKGSKVSPCKDYMQITLPTVSQEEPKSERENWEYLSLICMYYQGLKLEFSFLKPQPSIPILKMELAQNQGRFSASSYPCTA